MLSFCAKRLERLTKRKLKLESFEKFGQTLMPILKDIGIDAGLPDVKEIHNLIKG